MNIDDVPGWENPRKVLARHGLLPKRSFSQNFLVDRRTVERIAAAAIPPGCEMIIEIGPGAGTLSAALLRRGVSVLGIDSDRDMVLLLQREFAAQATRLTLLQADAASIDWPALLQEQPSPLAIVGNLPYAATGMILRQLVEVSSQLQQVVVMVQQEVAERLCAEPGSKNYGALTVFTAAKFRIDRLFGVTPGCFHPPPKVHSAVLRLVPLQPPRAMITPTFEKVVRAAFQQRRKTLRNALQQIPLSATEVEALLGKLKIDAQRRGETLTIEAFAQIAAAVDELKRKVL